MRTLDDTSWLKPQIQAWTQKKQPRLQLDDAPVAFAKQPQPSEKS